MIIATVQSRSTTAARSRARPSTWTAIAGLLCLVIRNLYYWFGVALAPSIFLALAGLNHVSEALGGNLAPYNVVTAAPDILLPVTLAWLFFRLFRLASPDGPEEIGL